MKKGITITQRYKLKGIDSLDRISEVIFDYSDKCEHRDNEYIFLKKMSQNEVTWDDELKKFVIPLSQADTTKLTKTYFVEAQVIFEDNATTKWDVVKKTLSPTLRTENVNGQSDGEEIEDTEMTIEDVFINGGTSTDDYNNLSNKPKLNDKTIEGEHTADYYGVQDKLTAGSNITIEDNVISASGGGSYSAGNGIDISNDTVSVDLKSGESVLGFDNGKLKSDLSDYYTKTEANSTFEKQLTAENGLYITRNNDGNKIGITFSPYLNGNKYLNTVISGDQYGLYLDYLKMYTDGVTTSKAYIDTELGKKQDALTAGTNITITDNVISASGGGSYSSGNGIDITNDTISVRLLENNNCISFQSGKLAVLGSNIANDNGFQASMPYKADIRRRLLENSGDYNFQAKIDSTHKLSADNVDDTSTTNKFTNATEKSKWNSKSKVHTAVYTNGAFDNKTATYSGIQEGDLICCNNNNNNIGAVQSVWLKRVVAVDVGTSDDEIRCVDIKEAYRITGTPPTTAEWGEDYIYQPDNVLLSTNGNIYVCTGSTFNSSTEVYTYTWQTYNIADKQDKTDITTDTTSTTVSLTLADNHEYRYTQELTSLTLTMPSGDFISSIVFASGSTPTQMTYDSSIKWSGDDVTNGQFVPSADKDYDICLYYNGLNVNGIVRGV